MRSDSILLKMKKCTNTSKYVREKMLNIRPIKSEQKFNLDITICVSHLTWKLGNKIVHFTSSTVLQVDVIQQGK